MTPTPCSLLLSLALSTVVVACSQGDDRGAKAARAHLDKGDYAAAMIEAKGAIQLDESDAEARLVLSRALIGQGDVAGAAVELRKALEHGADDATVVPLLAQALLASGEARAVLGQFATTTLGDPTATAVLQTTVAAAHAHLGDGAAAQRIVDQVLERVPDHAPAQVLQARLLAARGDTQGALARVDAVLARAPNHVEALLLRGEVHHHANPDAALASYRLATAAAPKTVQAHAAIIEILMTRRDEAGARAQFDKLKQVLPQHPETLLFDARFAMLAKDAARAREIVQPLLKTHAGDVRILLLAAGAEQRLSNLPQAETLLTQAVKVAPNAVQPRRQLADVLLRGNQPKRALEALAPLLAADPDARTLTLAGLAWEAAGDPGRAEEAFARATKLDPNATAARTALAFGQVGKGNLAGGFGELEAMAAADGAGTDADQNLVAARLRAGDVAGALKAVDALEKKPNGKAMAHALRGRIAASRNDVAGAEASFRRALAIDASYYPAVVGLAELDVGAGKPAAAVQKLRALADAVPGNGEVQLTLAQLLARTGAPRADVVQQFAQAAKVAPGEVAPRSALLDYLLAQRDGKAALAAAREAVAALPGSLELREKLGMAQLAAGEAQQAVATFGPLSATFGDRPAAHLLLAEAQFGAGDVGAAQRSLTRALELDPRSVQAQIGLARVALAQRRHDDALAIARTVQRAQPTQAAGYLVEADVEVDRKRPAAAIAVLRAALPRVGDGEAAMRLDGLLRANGDAAEADRTALQWIKTHPRDVAFRYYLGDLALAGRKFADAESHYRAVIDAQPDHALALNNVAWLLAHQNKPGALPLAERANRLLPDRAPLMDTLALALLAEGQAQRAFDLQLKAVQAYPEHHGLRLTLAKVYARMGQHEHARAELETLAKLGDRFDAQPDVAALLKTLK